MEPGRVSATDIGKDLKTNQVSHPSSSSGEVLIQSVNTNMKDKHTEEEIPVSSMPSDGSATQTPPTQATEPPAGGSPSAAAATSSHRIPSHVFATTSSTNSPAEWSVASNESLFSIHMSFTDRLSWVSKSGELSYTTDYSTISTPISVDVPSTNKTPNFNDETVSEAAAETMREVMREKESQQKYINIAKESPHSRSMSQHSDASVKSFAFPILTADADKNDSKNKKQPSRPSTPKTTPPHSTPPETPKAETPKATQNGGPRRWFSCFSCFPSCS